MSKCMKGLGLRGVSRIYLSIRFMKLLSLSGRFGIVIVGNENALG